ncbi:hypothetical protein SAMN05421688_2961 [Poseidonocella pacifica]|uniref:Uncharacterized protein n=1 Tax=Poseidonocella pacifica TaxID=871651 RepID=A0A1I0YFN1_9RHOB|nr:hypothetical protein [Poseidonocella pacifica]SFB11320.1 hypothetical protein SAMN05421688_2961 [Poseidonocella pacifica]
MTTETTREPIKPTQDRYSDIAQEARATAREALSTAERYAQDQAAGEAERVANAADAAAAEFDAGSFEAAAIGKIADEFEGVAARIRSTDLATATHEVTNFARKNPALFLGGAALLGFAAARFLKAREDVEPVTAPAPAWDMSEPPAYHRERPIAVGDEEVM